MMASRLSQIAANHETVNICQTKGYGPIPTIYQELVNTAVVSKRMALYLSSSSRFMN